METLDVHGAAGPLETGSARFLTAESVRSTQQSARLPQGIASCETGAVS